MGFTGRQYDLVVYGATGYTGKYVAEYVQENLATDFRWAIAGRSGEKLGNLAKELKELVSDRLQPEIEVVQLDIAELDALAKKTKVLITTVGPYWKYGTPVVEACAKNGTHYLDVTGEAPWVYEMIEKYHEIAKSKKSVIICQCGLDSVPTDILAYVLVRHIREKLKTGTSSCLVSVDDSKGQLSGGTAATILTLGTAYPKSHLAKTLAPFGLSPVQPSPAEKKRPPLSKGFLSTVLGYVTVPDLGILCDAPQNSIDAATVYRSWGLYSGGEYYGPNFRFAEYVRVKSAPLAVIQRYIGLLSGLLLLSRLGRWFVSKLVPAPGEGPEKEASKSHYTKYKAVATSDNGKRVMARFETLGNPYYSTALFVVEAAMEVLKGDGGLALKTGGLVTPATLGMGFVDRLEKASIKISVEEQ